jgi:hypothetical protein
MLTLRDILFTALLPAAWSAIVLAIAWRPWRKHAPNDWGHWAGPVALAGAFVLSFVGAAGRLPPVPPIQVTDWLPYIAMAAAVIGVIDATLQIPRTARWAIGCACIAAATWLLIRPLPAETHSLSTKLGWLVMRAVVWGGWWIALDGLAHERPGFSVPRDLLIVTAASALVLMMSGSKLLGLLGGSLAASLAAFVVIGFFADLSIARGGALVLAALLSGLLICGLFYASLARQNALLLLLAAVLTSAARFPPVKNLAGWKRHSVQIALAAVPAGLAVALTAAEFIKSFGDSGAGYQY